MVFWVRGVRVQIPRSSDRLAMPGFRHSPQDDTERIRQDLSDRYLLGFPILKELLQNADDAGVSQLGGEARRVVIVLCKNGLPGAEHRLLRTAGLCVLNDGVFKPEDANSITSLGLSNKADQIGAAGKFGLGLKSIFHWAEAFFYFSECPFENRGAKSQAPHWNLINPWWSDENPDESRHGEWEQQWKRSRDNDLKAFGNLQPFSNDFILPLAVN